MSGAGELQKRVAQEFGMSFDKVVRGFAEMGYGKDATAKAIGYNPSAFRRLLKRHNNFGITWPTVPEQREAGTLDHQLGPDALAKRRAAVLASCGSSHAKRIQTTFQLGQDMFLFLLDMEGRMGKSRSRIVREAISLYAEAHGYPGFKE